MYRRVEQVGGYTNVRLMNRKLSRLMVEETRNWYTAELGRIVVGGEA